MSRVVQYEENLFFGQFQETAVVVKIVEYFAVSYIFLLLVSFVTNRNKIIQRIWSPVLPKK